MIDHWLNPFGNYDEPNPPASFKPDLKGVRRKLVWWVRNPLHNFTFHWIGVKGYVLAYDGEFLGDGFALLKVYHNKPLWLLRKLYCLSYRGSKVEWYAGWRKHGGFGLSLRIAKATGASDVK